MDFAMRNFEICMGIQIATWISRVRDANAKQIPVPKYEGNLLRKYNLSYSFNSVACRVSTSFKIADSCSLDLPQLANY